MFNASFRDVDTSIYATYLRFKIHAIPQSSHIPHMELSAQAAQEGFSRIRIKKKLIFRAKGPEPFPSFSEISASLVRRRWLRVEPGCWGDKVSA